MNIVFLVIWLMQVPSNVTTPVGQFAGVFTSMKACNARLEDMKAKDVSLKGRSVCMQFSNVPDDASEAL